MTTIKSCTDIEQSKKLAEILPIESADMWYSYYGNPKYNPTIAYEGEQWFLCQIRNSSHDIPAWSLDALLEAMPQSITKYIESERCQKTFRLNLFRSYYHCCSYCTKSSVSDDDGDDTLYCFGRDKWVDACVAMILKLNELKLL